MVIPVVLLVAIIIMAVWSNLSAGAIILGTLLVALLLGAVALLLRFEWGIEEEEGVHEETGEHPAPRRENQDAETTKGAVLDSTTERDIVEECGEESFPASDPPAWTLGTKDQPASRSKGHQ